MTVAAPSTRSTHVPADRHRLTLARTLRGEAIKLTTLRSTWWSIAITAALTIGIAALISSSIPGQQAGFNGVMTVVMPIQFTALLAGILGAIAVTGEYSTGMIRSTLTADPLRGRVLASKAIVVALFLFLASLVIFLIAAVIASAILGGKGMPMDWSTPDAVILPLLAAAATMAVCALIGLSFGFLVRSGAGAIAATVGLLFVLPIVSTLFALGGKSWEWVSKAAAYLPLSAAQNAILPSDQAALSAGVAWLTLVLWVVAGLLGSWIVLRSRDA
ncbi:ABC transporter permease [uncultured Microbacterium sp.]|uniref:ABC transporter permease n=1 Tax=uncultured Microbacterium sp. TaxID=191216 RepID=UPI0025DF46F8|nr:ABC transporter permease [uncultured Microbacterium sp.]